MGRPPQDAERLADERDVYLPGSVSESAYFECKYAMESEVLRYAAEGLPAVIVNPTFVLGPSGGEGTIGTLIRAIARGWGRVGIAVEQNAVDVRDVAKGHLQAAEKGQQAQRYILGGTNVRVDTLMSQIAAILEAPAPQISIPAGWLRLVARMINFGALGAVSNHLLGINQWQSLSSNKAKHELGYKSRPLEVTLRDTINWSQNRGGLPPGEDVV
jgi:dihydroflavonol-4-reductase